MNPACSTTTDNWEHVQAMCREVLGEPLWRFIDECRAADRPESHLIAILHRVQAQYGHLSPTHLDAVAQLLGVPAAKVAGVASFYHFFRLSPRGKYVINVCMGTACYVKGAALIAQRLMSELGITWGETSTDGVFTMEQARCLGTCGLAPVVMIGDEVLGQVTPDQVPAILEKYLKRSRTATEA
jgi:NADH:ubiquinone oxidoreductase subunit E